MKRYLVSLIVCVTLMGGMGACKKYEEGPYLSFRSKEERVINNWKAKYVFRDDVDVTAWYNYWTIDLREDGRMLITDRDDFDSTVTQEGFWDLVNSNDDLQLLYTKPVVNPDRKVFEILKLKEEEFWFQELTDTVTWEFRLIPVSADSTN